MSKTLLFSVIASVLATGAYATSATVTSRDYVDAADALKQDLIDTDMVEIEVADKHGGTNVASLPALVSYDSNNGGITGNYFGVWATSEEQAINGVNDSDYDKIIPTLGLVDYKINEALEQTENKMSCAGWPDGATTYNATHTDENCWLWNKN